jgi:hypothetical protein
VTLDNANHNFAGEIRRALSERVAFFDAPDVVTPISETRLDMSDINPYRVNVMTALTRASTVDYIHNAVIPCLVLHILSVGTEPSPGGRGVFSCGRRDVSGLPGHPGARVLTTGTRPGASYEAGGDGLAAVRRERDKPDGGTVSRRRGRGRIPGLSSAACWRQSHNRRTSENRASGNWPDWSVQILRQA